MPGTCDRQVGQGISNALSLKGTQTADWSSGCQFVFTDQAAQHRRPTRAPFAGDEPDRGVAPASYPSLYGEAPEPMGKASSGASIPILAVGCRGWLAFPTCIQLCARDDRSSVPDPSPRRARATRQAWTVLSRLALGDANRRPSSGRERPSALSRLGRLRMFMVGPWAGVPSNRPRSTASGSPQTRLVCRICSSPVLIPWVSYGRERRRWSSDALANRSPRTRGPSGKEAPSVRQESPIVTAPSNSAGRRRRSSRAAGS